MEEGGSSARGRSRLFAPDSRFSCSTARHMNSTPRCGLRCAARKAAARGAPSVPRCRPLARGTIDGQRMTSLWSSGARIGRAATPPPPQRRRRSPRRRGAGEARGAIGGGGSAPPPASRLLRSTRSRIARRRPSRARAGGGFRAARARLCASFSPRSRRRTWQYTAAARRGERVLAEVADNLADRLVAVAEEELTLVRERRRTRGTCRRPRRRAPRLPPPPALDAAPSSVSMAASFRRRLPQDRRWRPPPRRRPIRRFAARLDVTVAERDAECRPVRTATLKSGCGRSAPPVTSPVRSRRPPWPPPPARAGGPAPLPFRGFEDEAAMRAGGVAQLGRRDRRRRAQQAPRPPRHRCSPPALFAPSSSSLIASISTSIAPSTCSSRRRASPSSPCTAASAAPDPAASAPRPTR